MGIGQIPGAGGSSVDPGNQAAQTLQRIMQMYQQAQAARQQQAGGGSGPGGMSSPGMPGGAPPSISAGAPPQVPGASPLPQAAGGGGGMQPGPGYPNIGMPPGRQPNQMPVQTPYEFGTKSGRNAAVADRAMGNVAGLVNKVKQEKDERERYGAYMDFLIISQAAANNDTKMLDWYQHTPEGIKRLQRLQKDFDWSPPGVEVPPPRVRGIMDALKRLGGGGGRQQQQQSPLPQAQGGAQGPQGGAASQQGGGAPASASPQGGGLIRPQGPQPLLSPEEMRQGARVNAGIEPSADAKLHWETYQKQRQDELDFKQEQLQQNKDLALQRMADARASTEERSYYHQQLVDIHKQQLANQLQLAQMRLEAKGIKSQIPTPLQGRVTQAEILRSNIARLQEMLADPAVQKNLPKTSSEAVVAGATQWFTRRTDEKFGEFMSLYESTASLYPILHGYRGGSQTQKVFLPQVGGPTFTVQGMTGALNAGITLSDNVEGDIKKFYPEDALWKNLNVIQEGAVPPSGRMPSFRDWQKQQDH